MLVSGNLLLFVLSQFAKMGEPQICHLTSSWRSHQITFLNQEGLINFFQGTPVFSNSGGDGGNANGSPLKFLNDGRKDFIVDINIITVLKDIIFSCIISCSIIYGIIGLCALDERIGNRKE